MRISRSSILPYGAEQMFSVVADLDSYSEFLNWCSGVEVLENANSFAEGIVIAKMYIAYGKLEFSFTTRNENSPGEAINIELVDGPFSAFSGQWQFQQLGDSGCKTSLEMEFAFKRSFGSAVVSKVFEKIASSQLESFQQRAHQLFAQHAQPSSSLGS